MSSPIRIRSQSESRLQHPRSGDEERISREIRRDPGPRHRSRSRASSTDSEIFHDAHETEQGMAPFIKNLSYGIHTALTKRDPYDLKTADRLIKKDVHRGVDAALKHERMKMGTQIVSYLSGSHTQQDHDIPQLTPFDKTREPCSEAEFERLLKNIQRNYPKYKGKSTELLYFLIEVGQLRQNNNITDQQLSRLLTNRFEDRLLKYFLSEIKRGRALLDVVNQIALDYIKTINPSQEVEKYLSFNFKFDNLADELTELKQAISLAHPRTSYSIIQQKYLDKILSLLPYEQRHDLLDDLNQRDDMIRLGLISRPYSEHELDNRILYHCRSLDRKNVDRRRDKRVHQVSSQPPIWPDSEDDLDSSLSHQQQQQQQPAPDVMFKVISELKSLNHNMKKVSEQNSHQIAQLVNERKTFKQQHQHQQQHQTTSDTHRPPYQQQQKQYNNDGRSNFPRSQFRSDQSQQQNSNNDQPTLVFGHDDDGYVTAVDDIKAHHGFRYLGQKITHDIKNARPRLKEKLRELRAARQTSSSPFQWDGDKYLAYKNEQINFPVIRKRPSGPPDLTREALEHFAKICYACGKSGCHGRGHPQTTCPYKTKPDSWLVCSNCKMGFHLAKDCLAKIVEN